MISQKLSVESMMLGRLTSYTESLGQNVTVFSSSSKNGAWFVNESRYSDGGSMTDIWTNGEAAYDPPRQNPKILSFYEPTDLVSMGIANESLPITGFMSPIGSSSISLELMLYAVIGQCGLLTVKF